jgi:hypothetical protein
VKNPSGHIRRLHLCTLDAEGRVEPLVNKPSLLCPQVETAGYIVLDDFSGGRWGDFNYLILSEGRHYLAAIC